MDAIIENQKEVLKSQESIVHVSDKLAGSVSELIRNTKSEEDLRIGFEKLLEPLCKVIDIKLSPKYEKSIYEGGRADAIHGRVIIEYEKPKAFKSEQWINHAFDQLIDYIQGEAKEKNETLFLFDPKYVGVGFDGEQIFFVQYRGDKSKPKVELNKQDFIRIGPYPFDQQSARTLLTYLRALSRKLLTAENLAEIFGPTSKIAPTTVSALVDALESWGSPRVQVFLNEWKRLFGIVYGEQFNKQQGEEINVLSKLYGVDKKVDFQKLLFSVHTYFALLMKLIAAELISLHETTFASSFSHKLTHALKDDLKLQLTDIEDGGIYAKRGITNFLEGDFFRWYLDAFSPRLEDAIREIARGLSEFEPATTTIDPASTRDLLKKLYQYLVPQEVRHKLGEYYTPDWLAELLLNEVGYEGATLKRFLDPACGSGTFLVLAIQRTKEHGRKEKLPKLEIAKRIVNNIWGFDLNPLAVIAARTNYLFALGDLVNELPRVEIPIYLTDSVLTPTRTTGDLFGEFLEVLTSVGKFQLPVEWVRDGGFLLTIAAPLVEEMVKNQYSTDEALARFKKVGLLFPTNEAVVKRFYNQIVELEKQNKNGIWARFLKNAFAPMVAGKFDFVVGNPPWIRWDYLSQEYRENTKHLWKAYGLFSLKGHALMMGSANPDFSMLFVYASSDYYLKDGAELGFLITQEVFKSKGTASGFRRFQLGNGKYLKILKAHDLVSIQPFEGATNKTAAIILKKGEKTSYPVPYILWTKKKGGGKITTDKLLNDALSKMQKKKYNANPIGSNIGAWQTISNDKENLLKIEGDNFYRARKGALTELYGIFWLEVKEVFSDGTLLVTNLAERGRTKLKKIEKKIEQDLLYPAVQGPNIKRWAINQTFFALIVNDKNHPMKGYAESLMKQKWPYTFSYLTEFKEDLLQRATFKKLHLQQKAPFYSQYNIGDYTFSPYKVVWKRMANDITAAVVSEIKTPYGYKMIIPLDTTVIFPINNKFEAHYLCAIINSAPVRDFIKSFSSAGRGFGTPSVMEHVGIPRFDSKNKLHQNLSQLSQELHNLKAENKLDNIEKLEKEVDLLVYKLFNIKDT